MNRILIAPLLAAGLIAATVSAGSAQQIDTAAREAILVDFTTGTVLLEKNADKPMPPSSMSKLMTSYLVFQQMKEGKLSLDDTMTVSETAWRKGGSKMFVHVGDQVRLEDLLRGVIVQSGNDACIVLAEGVAGSEAAFAQRLNEMGRQIGLTGSNFVNATGWPDEGHVMTARDLSTLAKRIITDHPEYYYYYSEKNFTYGGITQGNRNPLLYRDMGVDGLKTGHTEVAGYGLTSSALRDGRRLILVVNGLGSMQERADESARLLEWGFREFDNFELLSLGDSVGDAEVWLGEQAKVPLLVAQDVTLTLPRKARDQLQVKTVYTGPIPAPIQRGQQVGLLVVSGPNVEPVEIPLVAGTNVERLGFFGRIVAAVSHLVVGPAE